MVHTCESVSVPTDHIENVLDTLLQIFLSHLYDCQCTDYLQRTIVTHNLVVSSGGASQLRLHSPVVAKRIVLLQINLIA